jgi:hypothetical protein
MDLATRKPAKQPPQNCLLTDHSSTIYSNPRLFDEFPNIKIPPRPNPATNTSQLIQNTPKARHFEGVGEVVFIKPLVRHSLSPSPADGLSVIVFGQMMTLNPANGASSSGIVFCHRGERERVT